MKRWVKRVRGSDAGCHLRLARTDKRWLERANCRSGGSLENSAIGQLVQEVSARRNDLCIRRRERGRTITGG